MLIQRIRKRYYKSFRTSVINRPLSPNPLSLESCVQLLNNVKLCFILGNMFVLIPTTLQTSTGIQGIQNPFSKKNKVKMINDFPTVP